MSKTTEVLESRWVPNIETDRLLLRRVRLEDAEPFFDIFGKPEVHEYLCAPVIQSMEGEIAFVESVIACYHCENEPDRRVWSICEKSNPGLAIGNINVRPKRFTQAYEAGFALGPESWGNGYMTEAFRALIGFVFDHTLAQRIIAYHFSGNAASGRVMEKTGMTREGHLRQHFHVRGKTHDAEFYGILKSECTDKTGAAYTLLEPTNP